MMFITFSPLEKALLEVFYKLYVDRGFPVLDKIRASNRKNTGAGRYLDLHVDVESRLEDGYLDLEGQFIEMEGVPNGLCAVLLVKDHKPDQLEIAVYGNDPWDGQERKWSIA